MTDREALIRAICDEPMEDTPRLAFADWLEENEEPERAEFIRLQITLARQELEIICGGCGKKIVVDERVCDGCVCNSPRGCNHGVVPQHVCTCDECDPEKTGSVREGPLRRRERNLLEANRSDWFMLHFRFVGFGENLPLSWWPDWKPYAEDESTEAGPRIEGGLSRGFVSNILLPFAMFQAHHKAIFREQPIERVAITDMPIWPSGGNDTYYVGGLGQFPSKYWSQLENLPSRFACHEAISRVCVEIGRGEN